MTYRNIIDLIAYRILNVNVDIPKPNLGVDYAEHKDGIKAKQEMITHPLPKATRPPIDTQEYALTAIDGQQDKLTTKDFPTSSFYYGETVMEV